MSNLEITKENEKNKSRFFVLFCENNNKLRSVSQIQ